MELIEKQVDFISLIRNSELDLIQIDFSDIKAKNEYLLIIPFDIFYIENLDCKQNLDISVNISSVHYLIIRSTQGYDRIRLNIKCKLKSYKKIEIDTQFIDKASDPFNLIPTTSYQPEIFYSPISGIEKEENDPNFPISINFLISSYNDFLDLRNIYTFLPKGKIVLYNLINKEKYVVRNLDEFRALENIISFEESYSTNELYFDDNYPQIDIFIYFQDSLESYLPALSPHKIFLKFDDYLPDHLKNEISFLHTLRKLPANQNINSFLELDKSIFLNTFKNNHEFYLPVFTYSAKSEYLFLKKKFQERIIKEDGEFTFDFFAYCFDYEIRDKAEEQFQPFFKELFEEHFIDKKELNIYCVGIEYNKSGKVQDITEKNMEMNSIDLEDKIRDKLFNSDLIAHKNHYYVIYFFETYFK